MLVMFTSHYLCDIITTASHLIYIGFQGIFSLSQCSSKYDNMAIWCKQQYNGTLHSPKFYFCVVFTKNFSGSEWISILNVIV